MKGRVRRLKNFGKRVEAFSRDLSKEQGSKLISRDMGHDVSGLRIGTGKHRRLVFKEGRVSHAETAIHHYEELLEHFKVRGYEPGSYKLVKPRFVAVGEHFGIVQEYFNKPSLNEALGFLRARKEQKQAERKLQRRLRPKEVSSIIGKFLRNKSAWFRCKQFFNDPLNKSVDLEQLEEVEREFETDTEYLCQRQKNSNVILCGQVLEGDLQKVRLAIIDY